MEITYRKHIPSVTALRLSWKVACRSVLQECLVRAKTTWQLILIRQSSQQPHKKHLPEFKAHGDRCTRITWEVTLKMSRESNGWMTRGDYIRMPGNVGMTIPCP